jgi:AcrR family transcriptional regulator
MSKEADKHLMRGTMSKTTTSKAQQREATTARLIEVACVIFARDGYTAAATEDIVAQAGVTRGALYHHFNSKEGLFQAVLAQVQGQVAARIQAATAADADAWQQLIVGCTVFLQASLDPQVQRIMLIDAPAVLGWSLWREMDAQNSMSALRMVLEVLIAEGQLPAWPLEAFTRLLSGAMNEAALWIAQSEQPEQALAETTQTLTQMLGLWRQGARGG